MKKILSFAVAALLAASAFAQKSETLLDRNQLAKTPPMGWMTWNLFQGNISEELIKETADAMVENGFRDAGYEYIFINDLWQGGPSSDLGGVGCNYTEYQTQMSMWCMMSSVLALSNHWLMVLMPLLFLTAAIKPSIYRLISSCWD